MANVPPVFVQDSSAVLDYTFDWSEQLAANGAANISTATVLATGGAAISNKTVVSPTVTFRLNTTTVSTVPSTIDVTNHVVLSTGEEDERTFRVVVVASA